MLVYILSWRVASKRWFWVLSLASEQRFACLGPVADDRGFHWLVYGYGERIGASQAGKRIASSRFNPRCMQRYLLALCTTICAFMLGCSTSPLLMLSALLALFPSQYSRKYMLLIALACYLLAKLFEVSDREVFAILRGSVSGHTIKHLWAAAGCFCILQMLRSDSS